MILLSVHFILALTFSAFIFTGKTHLGKEHIVILYIIPVFGFLALLVIELMAVSERQGNSPISLGGLSFDDDIIWKPIKKYHNQGDLVPLEEAILIDEAKVRRRFMLEILYSDPYKYLDILNIAKYNDDIETSHYATTTIAQAQKEFQLAVQKLAVDVETHPNDIKILNKYIEILREYIQSGLLEEHLLKNLRLVYSKILTIKLNLNLEDKSTLISKLKNEIDLKNYVKASEVSSLLKEFFPEDEETWIEALRVCVETKDAVRLQKTINKISRTNIAWTRQGRDQISPWIKGILK